MLWTVDPVLFCSMEPPSTAVAVASTNPFVSHVLVRDVTLYLKVGVGSETGSEGQKPPAGSKGGAVVGGLADSPPEAEILYLNIGKTLP